MSRGRRPLVVETLVSRWVRFEGVVVVAAVDARGGERRMVVAGRGDDGEEVAGLGGGAWVVDLDGVGLGGGKVAVDAEGVVVVVVLDEDSGKPVAGVEITAADTGLERRADADMAAVAGAGCRAYRPAEEAGRPCGAEEERSVEGGEHNAVARVAEDRRGDMAVLGDTGRDGRCKEASRPERWVPNSRGRAEAHGHWGHMADDTGAERSLDANMASVAAWGL